MLAFIPQILSEEWGIPFYGKTYLLKVIEDEQGSDGCERQTANMPACFTEAGEDSSESTEEK